MTTPQRRVVVRRIAAPTPPTPPRARRRRLAAVVAVAALVLGVGATVLVRAGSGADSTQERADAVAAAKVRVAAMLTFSHEDLEGDLSVASGNTTGTFRSTYAKRLRSLIASSWEQRKASMSSQVSSASFAGMKGHDVRVRLVVESRLQAGSDQPLEQTFTVRATMRGHDGQWLVADLETV